MQILELVNKIVWGIPALFLILGVGLFLSIVTGFAQIRYFPSALKSFIMQFMPGKKKGAGVSSYQALCTALAATVGTGNLAGVAGAICLGGPGAIFWMWVCGLFGMVTKFAEAILAIRFREKNVTGEWVGGPMYYIRNGMGKRWAWLGFVYAFLGVVAAFGVGNATQINAVVGGVNGIITAYGGSVSFIGNVVMGLVLSVLICAILLGGVRRIGIMAEKLVPFASVLYLLLGTGVLIVKADQIPHALAAIVTGAFTPEAVTGGAIGNVLLSVRVGASRGVFTNEAGMGTAAIAHASANVEDPVKQGLMGIMEVFIDTIVICTMTALVILCSGVDICYGTDMGISLTTSAFAAIYGNWISIPIALSLCCFALATVLGWGLYGARCAQFIFGEGVWTRFVYIQGVTIILGAVLGTGIVWLVSETINGLMAIPNLIALAMLMPSLIEIIKKKPPKENIGGFISERGEIN